MRNFRIIAISVFVLLLVVACQSSNPDNDCSSNYKSCKDNSDMANHYSDWYSAQYACKDKFSELVKYGTPEYKLGDSYAFSSFLDGDDYPKKGIATLIAKVAVPNEFGTKVNGKQICEFDFETNKVIKQYGDFNAVNGFFEAEDYHQIKKSRDQQPLSESAVGEELILENGSKYVGELKDGKPNGKGTLFGRDESEKYEGEFLNGKMNGKGTLLYQNGDRYEGEFKDGKINGHGAFTQTNGNSYVGEFKDNQFEGQGTLTSADGKEFTGKFKNGKLVDK